MRHFCGELLSVNPAALNQYRYRNAFIRNERVVVVATDVRGQLLYFVAIGALNVGQIVLNFDPSIHTNARVHKNPKIYTYNPPISISKGTELGRFEMGSSVVLFVQNSATFDSLQGQEISFATPIAELLGQKEVLTNYLYFNFYLSPKNYHRFHESWSADARNVH
ncbi:hypothetical protein HSHS1_03010 [Helicobacter suis HS1]|nr:hypothetical protein HSHS1_03010 [Helicobacter suis HS1]